jgi:isoprenylcysteine carboxyl methyltransferase (ICMT) family protein YpbQ
MEEGQWNHCMRIILIPKCYLQEIMNILGKIWTTHIILLEVLYADCHYQQSTQRKCCMFKSVSEFFQNPS